MTLTDSYKKKIDKTINKILKVTSVEKDFADVSLLRGKAGLSIFFAYHHLYKNDSYSEEICFNYIDDIIDHSNTNDDVPFIGTGFTGLSWMICHLINQKVIDEDSAEVLEEVRDVIKSSISHNIIGNRYDLFYGYLGLGVYFNEDKQHEYKEQQQLIIEKLISNIIYDSNSIKWATSNDELELSYNLGIPHGIPGIILYLLDQLKHSENPNLLSDIITKGINWIISRKYPSGNFMFPNYVTDVKNQNIGGRLAWCHGDLGISFLLIKAGLALNNNSWYKLGYDVALNASHIKIEETGVVNDEGQYNLGFCHGTSGIAYIFSRLSAICNCQELHLVSQKWLEITLDKIENHLEMYSTETREDNQLGLLEGFAGIGLVLLSFVNKDKHDWDRLFLLN
ncbi:MAG: hypothetical protein EON51_02050 [Acinetobacter sp.]|nr:MAG: hypothetical protein EON51_02050 [Acinetobacter sp.]